MRRTWMAAGFAAVLGLGVGAGIGWSQDGGGEPPAGEQPGGMSAEDMAAWTKYMTPGAEHKALAADAGTWNVAGKFWMAGPDGPVTESKGTAKFRMLYGDRYQVQEYAGELLGEQFEGTGTTGFDNATREYVGTWFDSMGTGMMIVRGKADDKGVLTLTGEMPDFKGRTVKVREVLTRKDADSFVFEMHCNGGDFATETKVMELTYTRQK